MGCAQSRKIGKKKVDEKLNTSSSSSNSLSSSSKHSTRQRVQLWQFHTFDILLIRTVNQLSSSVVIDNRIDTGVKYCLRNVHIPESNKLPKYDRIGIIQAPGFDDLGPEKIDVTEATESGIVTRSLLDVLKTAEEVVLRPVCLSNENDVTITESTSASSRHNNKQDSSLAVETSWKAREQPRQELLETLLSMRVIGEPYSAVMTKALKPMFQWIRRQIKASNVTKLDEVEMNNLLEPFTNDSKENKFDKDNKDIQFDRLPEIFNAILKHPTLQMTFNSQEIFDLVSQFGHLRRGTITKKDFMTSWQNSMNRTAPARRNLFELLSGAFVSLCFQKAGFLPESQACFYRPCDFSALGFVESSLIKIRLGQELVVADSEDLAALTSLDP
eukprot:TRINITY_DN1570_c0_g1_i1.p1 TRINITY_DN1570_c0_g1~~TRINITY_DN1570_c0_g1_i1.p1  ORF type:complete len:386 (+),score=63.81 TRINITY_DN1570_c0_g1_i1:114-1271(+)